MIVLLILKIIGLVLLRILEVAGILIALILFFPVTYEAKGNIEQSEYKITVFWLFRLVYFQFQYKKESLLKLRICGIPLKIFDADYQEKKKRKKQLRKEKKAARQRKKRARKQKLPSEQKVEQSQTTQEHKERSTDQKLQTEQEYKIEQETQAAQETQAVQETQTDQKCQSEQRQQTEQPSQTSEKQSKALELFKKIWSVITAAKEEEILPVLIRHIKALLKHLAPKVLKGTISFGLSNPADTGKVVGVLSNLYILYRFDRFHINPDFEAEDNYIEGIFFIRGRIQCIFLVIFGIRLFREKRLRRFIKKVKRN